MVRIGGGIDGRTWNTPEEWLEIIKEMQYTAVVCPIDHTADADTRAAFKRIMAENDLVLGEVGAWVNPLHPDDAVRKKNIAYCQKQLALAEDMEANCCVNIVGCPGEIWDGAYAENYSADTYALIVDSIREIIDGVDPGHTFYTAEPMPWMVPDSPESYLKLLKDVDRERFAVHLDYTNMISDPRRYLHSSDFIRECFRLLGPHIKSIHAKDVIMESGLPCVIREVMPGRGSIDFTLVLRLAGQLGDRMTVYSEHLQSWQEYRESTGFLRKKLAETL